MYPSRRKRSSVNVLPSYDVRYKVIILGDAGVGKSQLIRTAVGESFSPVSVSTIGIDYLKRQFIVDDKTIQLDLWDTAGSEKFRALSLQHFRDAKCFVLVFDITDVESFQHIKTDWMPLIHKHFDGHAPLFLVGNKIDLVEKRQVSREAAQQFLSKQCGSLYVETSAKTSSNVDTLFAQVATALLGYHGIPIPT
ncbi:hypothetical protein Ciccas_013549, partial [Cichlidogyrus casuarinus]